MKILHECILFADSNKMFGTFLFVCTFKISPQIVMYVCLTSKINMLQMKEIILRESLCIILSSFTIVIRFIRKVDDFYVPECTIFTHVLLETFMD